MVINTEVAWDFLISNASRLVELQKVFYPNLSIQDLILGLHKKFSISSTVANLSIAVTGLRRDLRYATFNWIATEPALLPSLEFDEHENPSLETLWGDWKHECKEGFRTDQQR
jgi:predicted YcjX-like family ATPase